MNFINGIDVWLPVMRGKIYSRPKNQYKIGGGLEVHLKDVLVDFKPQTQSDERIKLSVLVNEIESQAMDNNYVVHMDEVSGNDWLAHTIARQILQGQRGQ